MNNTIMNIKWKEIIIAIKIYYEALTLKFINKKAKNYLKFLCVTILLFINRQEANF